MTISPCAMLLTPMTPKVMARPMAASSNTEPSETPYQTFWPISQATRPVSILAIAASTLSFSSPSAALEMRDAYVRWAEGDASAYKVFTRENAPRFTVDLPLANAHQSEMTTRDFSLLLPLIGLFIAACLVVQFRDVRAVVVAFGKHAGRPPADVARTDPDYLA